MLLGAGEPATDSAAAAEVEAHAFRSTLPLKAYEEAGIGPEDVDVAEVYDLSTALELDWIEDLQLCPRGDAAALLRAGDTAVGGKIPVNASGGLACFGEAVHVGGVNVGVFCAGHRTCVLLIGDNEEDVGLV